MTPVQCTKEEAYNAADLSLGLSQNRTMPEVILCFCHFETTHTHTRFLLCIYHGEGGSSFPRTGIRINSVSHLKDDKSAATDTHTHKNTSCHTSQLRPCNRR